MLEIIFTIIIYIILFGVVIRLFVWCYQEYKNINDTSIKSLFIALFIAFMFPTVIYILDRNNIFSNLNFLKNVSSDNWHGFLATYGSTLVSTIVSSIILIIVTSGQLERTKEDNDKLSKEQLRLEHLPVLKYKCNCSKNIESGITYIIDENISDNRVQVPLNIIINNIGLGIAHKLTYSIVLSSNTIIKGIVDNDKIDKEGEIQFSINFDIPKIEIFRKHMLLVIFYQDILGNKYAQKFSCSASLHSGEIDGEKIYNPYVDLLEIDNYKVISENYDIKEENEFHQIKKDEKIANDKKLVRKLHLDETKVDNAIERYFKQDVDILKLISNYFSYKFSDMEGGGTRGGYEIIDNNYIRVTSINTMGININEQITVLRILNLDLKSLEFSSDDLVVESNTLKITDEELDEFKKYLKRFNKDNN